MERTKGLVSFAAADAIPLDLPVGVTGGGRYHGNVRATPECRELLERVPLSRRQSVRVDGKKDVAVVPEHLAHGRNRDAGCEHVAGESVAEAVHPHLGELPRKWVGVESGHS